MSSSAWARKSKKLLRGYLPKPVESEILTREGVKVPNGIEKLPMGESKLPKDE